MSLHQLIVETMLLRLVRQPSKNGYTEGILLDGESKICDTLEDTVRTIRNHEDKVIGYTAIPTGKYRVDWTYSPKFKRYLPLLCQVPWFKGIRIHAGNSADDSTGCILVGVKDKEGHLSLSQYTLNRVNTIISSAILRNESVYIEVS